MKVTNINPDARRCGRVRREPNYWWEDQEASV